MKYDDDFSDTLILDCACHSPEHIIRFSLYDWDSDFPELLVEVQANHHLPWYKRIVPSVKYLFGAPSLRWHDAMVKDEDIPRLKGLITKYEKAKKKGKPVNE